YPEYANNRHATVLCWLRDFQDSPASAKVHARRSLHCFAHRAFADASFHRRFANPPAESHVLHNIAWQVHHQVAFLTRHLPRSIAPTSISEPFRISHSQQSNPLPLPMLV